MSEAPEGSVAAARTGTRTRRAIGIALLAAIVAGSFLVEVQQAVGVTVQFSGPALVQQLTANLRQFYCLQDEIRREVPQGAAVALGGGTVNSQALSQLVVLWAEPEPSLRHSGWTLSLVTPGACDGLGVHAVFHP